MSEKGVPRLSSLQWFVSIAAGVAMFLLPQDAQSYFSDTYRQIFVAACCFVIALVLLGLFKLYEPIGVAVLSAMLLTTASFGIRVGARLYEGGDWATFTMAMNVYDGFSWGLVWFMPILCCLLMRLFAQGKWATPEAKFDFCCFFKKASLASGLYLLILLLSIFLYFRPMNFEGLRQLNLTPLSQLTFYLQAYQEGNPDGLKLFLGDIAFFVPVGFFLFSLTPKWRVWQKLLAALLLMILIEGLQYALNTGAADIDDVLCYLAGFGLGGFGKFLLDRVRSAVTKRNERKICYVWDSGEKKPIVPEKETAEEAESL